MSEGPLVPRAVDSLGELQPLVERARSYADAATADNTRRAYASDWRNFVRWCVEHSLDPNRAEPPVVATYLANMADDGFPPPSIERAYAGVASHLRLIAPDKWPRRRQPEVVVQVISGIRRRLAHLPSGKLPVTDQHLRAMLAAPGGGLRAARNRAILLVGFAGAFRRSELVALNVDDIAFTDNGLLIQIRRSKTDQRGRGREIGIMAAKDPAVCPVGALRGWLAAGAIEEGPILRPINRSARVLERRLCDRTVANVVKHAAAAIGLNADDFAGHSLRAGFVTTAAARNKSTDSIMRQTGHRSEATVRRYIRHANLFVDNASDGIL